MKLNRWLAAIGVVMAVGILQVAQKNTVYLKGYALGDRVEKAHKEETEISWLETRVLRLTSPEHLSDAVQERHLNLVAWSLLAPDQGQRLVDKAPVQPDENIQLADGHDTTD